MKTCIITGASSGIGRAAAIETGKLKEFANIVLIARNIEELRKTKEAMDRRNDVLLFPYDLADLKGIPGLVKSIYETCGSIDCLLNIAGYTDPQPLLNTSLENMQKTYDVNVFAVFLMIKECVKYMKKSSSIKKILNVASTAGMSSRPGWLSYASSKAAVISMSQTLTDELAEYGIRIFCISPGRCATALRRKLAPDEDQSKIMQPEEVGRIISSMISEDEQCLDGQNITIRKKI